MIGEPANLFFSLIIPEPGHDSISSTIHFLLNCDIFRFVPYPFGVITHFMKQSSSVTIFLFAYFHSYFLIINIGWVFSFFLKELK
jgi:hypothetical protein